MEMGLVSTAIYGEANQAAHSQGSICSSRGGLHVWISHSLCTPNLSQADDSRISRRLQLLCHLLPILADHKVRSSERQSPDSYQRFRSCIYGTRLAAFSAQIDPMNDQPISIGATAAVAIVRNDSVAHLIPLHWPQRSVMCAWWKPCCLSPAPCRRRPARLADRRTCAVTAPRRAVQRPAPARRAMASAMAACQRTQQRVDHCRAELG